MACYKIFFFEFWDQWWVLHSFTKYYQGDWALDFMYTQFSWSLDNSWGIYLVHSVYSDNDLVLFHLWWKETRLTYEKLKVSKCIVSGVVLLKLVCFNLCWNSDYELGFYSNQFWGFPKLTYFHKTLNSISVRKSWNYCNSASWFAIK